MGRKKIDDFFNVPSKDDIEGLSSLSNALSLINEAGAISESEEIEPRKFIVQKKQEAKDLAKVDYYEKIDDDLDEIAAQADSAFQELMDITLNTTGGKVGDIASAAKNFLDVKMNAKMAKLEKKFKMMNLELQQRKQEYFENRQKANAIVNSSDDIMDTNENGAEGDKPSTPKPEKKQPFDRSKFY